jgi:hypothetical protein
MRSWPWRFFSARGAERLGIPGQRLNAEPFLNNPAIPPTTPLCRVYCAETAA